MPFKELYNGTTLNISGTTFTTQEGMPAVDHLVAYLEQKMGSPPLTNYTREIGLDKSSQEHVNDQAVNDNEGH